MPALLILVSCFTHASWNLLARGSDDEGLFIGRKLALLVPLGACALALTHFWATPFPLKAWVCIGGAGLVGGFYFRFLALAYGSEDFTVVYPAARALPVLMIAGIDVARARYPSAAGVLGLALVMAGCFLAPQDSLRDFRWSRYRGKAVLWIVLTAATMIAFTVLDKTAAEVINPGAMGDRVDSALRRGLPQAAKQCALWHMFACAGYMVSRLGFGARSRPAGDDAGQAPAQVGWGLPAAGALLGYATYTLVLWAFQLTPQTSYLVAFRQFSIVLGVVAAFGLHQERGLSVRLPASLVIVAGLVVIALWGR
jgi:drug/metabolite transporter (DMT)-like permease